MRLDLGPSLAALKAALILQVDTQAERVRLQFLTAGAGQAAEYMATESQARAWQALADAGAPPADLVGYPFVLAEEAAYMAATGLPSPGAAVIVAQVIAQADAWQQAGSAIKEARRTAKLRIEAATTVVEVRAAAVVAWPGA